ncbi:MAG: cob(I)yrinic acid a,c-diamide adenosyltransferase [Phyllobacteriaceae bacterium]|nr:cob(I)yrinic acid a,c-diamide adenosyltransferase [Phyllobacteriaceae bacterium]
MVKLNRIYTRTGDDGTTGLVNGERRPKHDLRIETYGTVDEANAFIGVACAALPAESALVTPLARVQNDLFDLGADLATPEAGKSPGFEPLRIVASQVARVEADIDALNARLNPLKSFVLAGGSPAAAHLHVARTVARRAERLACALAAVETINPEAVKYLNRVSDFLFVAARVANDDGGRDVLWVPGRDR